MSGLNRFDGDVRVDGNLSATTMTVPSASIGDSQVKSDALIAASKLQHEHRPPYAQSSGANAAAETKAIFTAKATGVLQSFQVGQIVPPDTAAGSSGRTVTFDLKKNGTTVLSAAVTLNSTNAAYALTSATLSVVNFVAGDVFTVVVTVGGSAGTHSLGPFAFPSFYENPS